MLQVAGHDFEKAAGPLQFVQVKWESIWGCSACNAPDILASHFKFCLKERLIKLCQPLTQFSEGFDILYTSHHCRGQWSLVNLYYLKSLGLGDEHMAVTIFDTFNFFCRLLVISYILIRDCSLWLHAFRGASLINLHSFSLLGSWNAVGSDFIVLWCLNARVCMYYQLLLLRYFVPDNWCEVDRTCYTLAVETGAFCQIGHCYTRGHKVVIH